MSPATEDALHAMTQMAAVIFAGRVVAIRQPQRAGGAVEIEFAVEDAIRGVSGGTYVLREWGGLWCGRPDVPRGAAIFDAAAWAGTCGAEFAGGRRGWGDSDSWGGRGCGGVGGGWARGGSALGGDASGAGGFVCAKSRWHFLLRRLPAVRADVGGTQTDVTLATPGVSAIEQGVGYSAVIGLLRGWERDAAR